MQNLARKAGSLLAGGVLAFGAFRAVWTVSAGRRLTLTPKSASNETRRTESRARNETDAFRLGCQRGSVGQ